MLLRPWQFGASVVLVNVALALVACAWLGERLLPSLLLIGMVCATAVIGSITRLCAGHVPARAHQDAAVSLALGVFGCLALNFAQTLSQPQGTIDHRHLDAMVWWLLFLLLAQVVSTRRDEDA